MTVVIEELATPDLPEIMTTENSPIRGLSIPEQLKKRFIDTLKPSPYIVACSQMTEDAWHKIYPPNVNEAKQLPGQGIPFWIYQDNHCTDCHLPLTACHNNPYGPHGEIGRARAAAQKAHRDKLALEAQATVTVSKVDAETGEVVQEVVAKEPGRRGKQPNLSILREMPSSLMGTIKQEYITGEVGSLLELQEKHNILASVIRDFLFAEGVLRKKGQLAPGKTRTGRVASGPTEVPKDLRKEIRDKYVAGSNLLALNEEYGISQIIIRDFLATEKVLRKRGEGLVKARAVRSERAVREPKVKVVNPNPGKRGKARTTNFVTPELVAKAVKMVQSGKGMVVTATELNVNPNELSVALKAAGVIIKRGRK